MNDKISHMGHAHVSGIHPSSVILCHGLVKIDMWIKENEAKIANNDDDNT